MVLSQLKEGVLCLVGYELYTLVGYELYTVLFQCQLRQE